MVSGKNILELLDAMVIEQPGPPHLVGTVGIAISNERTTWWWLVHLKGQAITTSVSDVLSEELDAALFLDEENANAFFLGKRLENKPLKSSIQGDKALLKKFIGRFFNQQSVLTIQKGI